MRFGCSFWCFWNLHAQKTRFLGVSENWFIFPLIFKGFWKPRVDYKITEKSFLGAILRYGGSKEEAPPSHHGSKVLISMDLPSMFVCLFLKWILRYMLIDIVTRLRANFDVELIMQGVLSFTVHPSVIPCTAISFQFLGLAKGSGGRGWWI